MFILDTDTLSHTQYASSALGRRIVERIAGATDPAVLTMATVAEQLRGRLARCNSTKSAEEYVERLLDLRQLCESYQAWAILDFDDAAAAVEFKKLKAAKVRIGTMDLRIASIALARNATVVTANVSDLRRVPGLKVEDWTA